MAALAVLALGWMMWGKYRERSRRLEKDAFGFRAGDEVMAEELGTAADWLRRMRDKLGKP